MSLKNCEEFAKGPNKFFANAVKNLNISKYENFDSLAENIDDPTPTAIAKWRNHPSILAIASGYKNRENFSFNFVPKEDLLTEIKIHYLRLCCESVFHKRLDLLGNCCKYCLGQSKH